MKRKTVHQSLGLPSSYAIHTSVDGYINNVHHSLRMLRSSTHGHNAVWAESTSWEAWVEISQERFAAVASRIIGSVQKAPSSDLLSKLSAFLYDVQVPIAWGNNTWGMDSKNMAEQAKSLLNQIEALK